MEYPNRPKEFKIRKGLSLKELRCLTIKILNNILHNSNLLSILTDKSKVKFS